MRSVLDELQSLLLEADGHGGYPVGTKRKRETGVWKKLKDGVWKLVKPAKSKPADDPNVYDTSKAKEAPKSSFSFTPHPKQKPLKWPGMGKFPEPGSLAKPSPSANWHHEPYEPRTSSEAHKKRGDWTPERKKLHAEIFDHFLSSVPPTPKKKQPIAIMMMGIPASGKSRLIRNVSDKFVKVDADAIKEMLPEYQAGVKSGDRNAASYVHDESGYLASTLRDTARKQRKNVAYDGTGKYASSYLHRIQQFQDDGYHVQVMMAHVEPETAIQRAKKRGKETGRWVSSEIIRSNARDVPHNFEKIARAADSAFLFDNEGERPDIKWAKHKDGETEFDKDYVKKFWGKYGARRSQAKITNSGLEVASQVRGMLEKDEPEEDPMELAREIEKKTKPEPDLPDKFTSNQGIIEPEPEPD